VLFHLSPAVIAGHDLGDSCSLTYPDALALIAVIDKMRPRACASLMIGEHAAHA